MQTGALNIVGRTALGLGMATLILGAATSAQAPEAKLTMRIESGGQAPVEMTLSVGQGRLRMDPAPGMSMIWTPDAMLMIQHEQRSYMRFGAEQLKMMQQMMSKMPQGRGGASPEPSFDPASITFRETGRRERIGEWDAFEVEMTTSAGQTGALWLTTDIDVGFIEAMAGMGETLSGLMPMLGGGGAMPGGNLARYRALAQASGLPDGRVVRLVAQDGGQTTTVTIVNIEAGPLPADTFTPPAGYTEMQMPNFGGLGGR